MYIGKLDFKPVLENKDLVPESVYKKVLSWPGETPKDTFWVAEINPNYMGGIQLCEEYNIPIEIGVNCLVVEGKRAQDVKYAVCLVPIGFRYNMSSTVRKAMNSRTVSVAPLEMVLEKTGMEYGSITPIGLPEEWIIYMDSMILEHERIVVGGGYTHSKLSILSKAFLEMSNVVVLEGIAKKF